MSRLLIANRSEIALRVMRAAKSLGWTTLAVYSEADEKAPHVITADEAICIGPPRAQQSYANSDALLQAALKLKADYVHPGYGFLSENHQFARSLVAHQIKWVGPSPDVIEQMGDKLAARQLAEQANVPVIPGSLALVDTQQAVHRANEIGYPLMLKAAAGGGGIGMQMIHNEQELKAHYDSLSKRAENLFGQGTLYLEKIIHHARHIEIQLMADGQGHMATYGERECSVQRRHQKLIEEAPSPLVDEFLRQQMCDAALRLAKAVGYVNAGTVEFLVDEEKQFYFLEMNTRIQVEHAITEWITSSDLVKMQLQIAAGDPLPASKPPHGHALECRVYAEDPDTLRPCPGTIEQVQFPQHEWLRIDHALAEAMAITPYYDALLAKISVYGEHRSEALQRMQQALGETTLSGIKQNIPLLQKILNDGDFQQGQYNTLIMHSYLK